MICIYYLGKNEDGRLAGAGKISTEREEKEEEVYRHKKESSDRGELSVCV